MSDQLNRPQLSLNQTDPYSLILYCYKTLAITKKPTYNINKITIDVICNNNDGRGQIIDKLYRYHKTRSAKI